MARATKESRPGIIFCTPSFLPVIGGIENWVFQVASRLVDACSVHVIAKHTDKSWPKREVISGINVLRYTAHVPRPLPSRLNYLVQALSIIKIVRTISREASRIAFNFFDPRPAQVYAAIALRHGLAQSVICSVCGTPSEFAPRHLKKLAVQASDLMIGLSEYAMKAFGVPHPNTHVCYPVGAMPADFASRIGRFESKQVVTLCRVHPRKNLEFLIDVAAKLPKVSFVVAGDYTRHYEYYRSLITRASTLGVENVQFMGMVDESFLHRLYGDSTLFFLPSRHEMFGLVFSEAMSYGLPVVAPTHTAIPEAVGSGNGILYDPGDLEACCRGIQDLVSSREHWAALSTKAKRFMEQRYAQDHIGKYAQILLAVAERGEK